MAKAYIVTCTAALGPPHTWRTFVEGDLVTKDDFYTAGTFEKMERKGHLREATDADRSVAAEATTRRDREHVYVEGMSLAETDSETSGRKTEAKRAAAAVEEKRQANLAARSAGSGTK